MWLKRFILMYLVQKINLEEVLEKYDGFERTNETFVVISPPLLCERNHEVEWSKIKVQFYDFAQNFSETYGINVAYEYIGEYLKWNRSERMDGSTWALYVPGLSAQTDIIYMKKAFMKKKKSFLIFIDYDDLFEDTASYREKYEVTVKYLNGIAEEIVDFLKRLASHDINYRDIRYIGQGLGAQIIGKVGYLFDKNSETITWITALDPAGPCFFGWEYEDEVKKGAAKYVEIYHCNPGGLGTASFNGDVDFLANITIQSDCNITESSEESAECSHDKCVQFYSSIVNKDMELLALKCDRPSDPERDYYKDFEKYNCHKLRKENITIGFDQEHSDSPMYYFDASPMPEEEDDPTTTTEISTTNDFTTTAST